MRKKEPSFETVQLPHLRIEVSELLEILERVAGQNHQITAETVDVGFDDLEEMKTHKAEISERPKIKVGPVELKTEDYSGRPSLSVYLSELRRTNDVTGIEEAQLLLKAIEKELLPFASRLAHPMFRTIVSAAASIILTALLVWPNYDSGAGTLQFYVVLLSVYWLLAAAFGALLRRLAGDRTVYHQPRETWLQRNSGLLVSSILAAGVTALVTYALTK